MAPSPSEELKQASRVFFQPVVQGSKVLIERIVYRAWTRDTSRRSKQIGY